MHLFPGSPTHISKGLVTFFGVKNSLIRFQLDHIFSDSSATSGPGASLSGRWLSGPANSVLWRAHPDPGSWIPDLGSRILDPGSWIPDLGSRILDPGSWTPDLGSRILDPASWIPDLGSRILDPVYWVPDLGSRIPNPYF